MITFTISIEKFDLNSSEILQIIPIYQQAFAEPPWNETWKGEEVLEDIRYAFAQQNTIALIAKLNSETIGFTWGYRLPKEKFPFLDGIDEKSIYGDEMAVKKEYRREGVGTKLLKEMWKLSKQMGMKEWVCRTDNNSLVYPLLIELGAKDLLILDPEYPSRTYISKKL